MPAKGVKKEKEVPSRVEVFHMTSLDINEDNIHGYLMGNTDEMTNLSIERLLLSNLKNNSYLGSILKIFSEKKVIIKNLSLKIIKEEDLDWSDFKNNFLEMIRNLVDLGLEKIEVEIEPNICHVSRIKEFEEQLEQVVENVNVSLTSIEIKKESTKEEDVFQEWQPMPPLEGYTEATHSFRKVRKKDGIEIVPAYFKDKNAIRNLLINLENKGVDFLDVHIRTALTKGKDKLLDEVRAELLEEYVDPEAQHRSIADGLTWLWVEYRKENKIDRDAFLGLLGCNAKEITRVRSGKESTVYVKQETIDNLLVLLDDDKQIVSPQNKELIKLKETILKWTDKRKEITLNFLAFLKNIPNEETREEHKKQNFTRAAIKEVYNARIIVHILLKYGFSATQIQKALGLSSNAIYGWVDQFGSHTQVTPKLELKQRFIDYVNDEKQKSKINDPEDVNRYEAALQVLQNTGKISFNHREKNKFITPLVGKIIAELINAVEEAFDSDVANEFTRLIQQSAASFSASGNPLPSSAVAPINIQVVNIVNFFRKASQLKPLFIDFFPRESSDKLKLLLKALNGKNPVCHRIISLYDQLKNYTEVVYLAAYWSEQIVSDTAVINIDVIDVDMMDMQTFPTAKPASKKRKMPIDDDDRDHEQQDPLKEKKPKKGKIKEIVSSNELILILQNSSKKSIRWIDKKITGIAVNLLADASMAVKQNVLLNEKSVYRKIYDGVIWLWVNTGFKIGLNDFFTLLGVSFKNFEPFKIGVENGRYNLSVDTLGKILNLLNADVDNDDLQEVSSSIRDFPANKAEVCQQFKQLLKEQIRMEGERNTLYKAQIRLKGSVKEIKFIYNLVGLLEKHFNIKTKGRNLYQKLANELNLDSKKISKWLRAGSISESAIIKLADKEKLITAVESILSDVTDKQLKIDIERNLNGLKKLSDISFSKFETNTIDEKVTKLINSIADIIKQQFGSEKYKKFDRSVSKTRVRYNISGEKIPAEETKNEVDVVRARNIINLFKISAGASPDLPDFFPLNKPKFFADFQKLILANNKNCQIILALVAELEDCVCEVLLAPCWVDLMIQERKKAGVEAAPVASRSSWHARRSPSSAFFQPAPVVAPPPSVVPDSKGKSISSLFSGTPTSMSQPLSVEDFEPDTDQPTPGH
jgi:transposase-like protein